MRKFKFIFSFIVLVFFISSCDSNQLYLQKKVSLNFVDSNKDTIKVDIYVLSDDTLSFIKAWYQNQEYTLPQVVSADGARYSDGRCLVCIRCLNYFTNSLFKTYRTFFKNFWFYFKPNFNSIKWSPHF